MFGACSWRHKPLSSEATFSGQVIKSVCYVIVVYSVVNLIKISQKSVVLGSSSKPSIGCQTEDNSPLGDLTPFIRKICPNINRFEATWVSDELSNRITSRRLIQLYESN